MTLVSDPERVKTSGHCGVCRFTTRRSSCPTGGTRPGISQMNYEAGRYDTNEILADVNGDGRISIFNGGSGTARVRLAATGWVLS
jgi:hypothetical protein